MYPRPSKDTGILILASALMSLLGYDKVSKYVENRHLLTNFIVSVRNYNNTVMCKNNKSLAKGNGFACLRLLQQEKSWLCIQE